MLNQWRENILPTVPIDAAWFMFVLTLIPTCFIFQMCIVLPSFHVVGSFMFILTWLCGIFLFFNIMGNMFLCMVQDTSIKTVLLRPPEDSILASHWRLCAECKVYAPPRSWHCDICKTCILKRDHHCVVIGYCVGHMNQRYFFMFVIYTLIGCVYAFCYNSLNIWWFHADIYINPFTLLKMICPMVTIVVQFSLVNIYLIIYEMNVLGLGYSVFLLFFHIRNALNGCVSRECRLIKYDLGWKQNLQIIFGIRWYLVWLSPFVSSELPHDGVHWDNILYQSSKNK